VTIHQLKMLKLFTQINLTTKQALELNQTTFGSLCYRRYLKFDADKKLFQITQLGRDRFNESQNWDYHRKVNNGRLSVYTKIPKMYLVSKAS
jgi:hypothetical protein